MSRSSEGKKIRDYLYSTTDPPAPKLTDADRIVNALGDVTNQIRSLERTIREFLPKPEAKKPEEAPATQDLDSDEEED